LPDAFAALGRRLEQANPKGGTRQYIRVLRLLESYDLPAVTAAIERALALAVSDADAVRLLLEKVRFFRVAELLTQLLEAREERVLGRLRSQLACLDLLLLDEFGYVAASQVFAELLFEVMSTSYERRSVMVTTNLPFDRWTGVLCKERQVAATLDRLTHSCHLLNSSTLTRQWSLWL
jgi:DNA replication protein DnaC